jgi:hypothetical protein
VAVTQRALRVLRPYFESGAANADGEIGMHCPLHQDDNRSSSLNLDSQLWYCNTCGIGMSDVELIQMMRDEPERIVPPPGPGPRSFDANARKSGPSSKLPDEGAIAGWSSALLADRQGLKKFQRLRGLSIATLRAFDIGWDRQTNAFTIPVRDRDGILINVRRYQPEPKDGRRKIWSVSGHGEPALYPINIFDDDPKDIIIAEGEWDTLLTIQNGFAAVTRTGTADTWRPSWNNWFRERRVWLCHDMDTKGQVANKKLMRELRSVAESVAIITLPYEVRPKHGEDLTDYFHRDGHTAPDLRALMELGTPIDHEPPQVNVLDSFSADLAGKTARLRVTITGKKNPPYLLPKKMHLQCGQDAGQKCMYCPMNEIGGSMVHELREDDPVILSMVGAPKFKLLDSVRDQLRIQPCRRLTYEAEEHIAVEELYVRPAIDQHSHDPSSGDYTNRKIYSVGRHDSTPNQTVAVVGAVYPNPNSQHNEFQAWEVNKTETMIDLYEVTQAGVDLMRVFQTKFPLKKVKSIAQDLSRHVTRIYGRPHMHALMDLVWHSVLAFNFDGSLEARGWLDALIVGDTRTGKSKAAQLLMNFYGAGDMVSCEAASFAGIVGGLQQMGGKEWEITWGAIPINDRRLVALDEVSGLSYEQIAQMSSIRSSGVAELTKIRSEKTWARTRLLWLGNPRDGGRMQNYTHGVSSIRPLIGNMEDIARFDLALTVSADEVESSFINRQRAPEHNAPQVYTKEACRELIQWVWSRQPDDIAWEQGAEQLVYDQAVAMGERYIENPPLVQAANVRFKIARVAVALAARTFSTDETFTKIVVTKRHVTDAVAFMDALYGLEGFGYRAHSEEVIRDNAEALKKWHEARHWLRDLPDLVKFLRGCEGKFRNNDVQDMLNVDREMAASYVNSLWGYRLVTRQAGNVLINPALNNMLREIMKEYDDG